MKSRGTLLTVVGLSLAVWLFFYQQDLPLGALDTAVVVGFWLAAVLAAKWVWFRLRGRHPNPNKEAKA